MKPRDYDLQVLAYSLERLTIYARRLLELSPSNLTTQMNVALDGDQVRESYAILQRLAKEMIVNRIELENLREVALIAFDKVVAEAEMHRHCTDDCPAHTRAEADEKKAQWAIDFLSELLGD